MASYKVITLLMNAKLVNYNLGTTTIYSPKKVNQNIKKTNDSF